MLRRLEPASALTALACVLWTLPVLFGWRSYMEAGALTRETVWNGEYWRFLGATLLHAGPLHLSLNVFSLYFVGSAVARGTTRGHFFLFTAAGALTGHAASLLFTTPEAMRMGISGGVFGLVAQVLAIERALSRDLRAYFRRPNVRLVAFLLALNVGLGLFFPAIDHAAHAGGFLAGLGVGFSLYGRGGLRPLAAAAALVVFVAAPLAYAIHPFRDVDFQLHRVPVAARSGDREDLAQAWRRVLALDPAHPRAAAWLADHDDDPALLDGIRKPRSAREAAWVRDAYLALADRRAAKDPEAAERLIEKALEQGEGVLGTTREVARRSWRIAWRLLEGSKTPPEQIAYALEATRGFVEAEPPEGLYDELLRVAHRAGAAFGAAPHPELCLGLGTLYRRLADQTPEDDPHYARLLCLSAFWRAKGGDPDTEATFRAALELAEARGDAVTAELARAMLR